VLGVRALAHGVSAAFPLQAGVSGFAFPQGVETLLPAAIAFDRMVLGALLLGGGAALLALLLRGPLREPPFRALFLVALAGIFAPFGARTFGELVVPVFLGALRGLAFLVAMAVFLRDDPRAYAFAAALLALAGAGTDLVSSGIAPWVWNGAAVFAGVALFVAFRGFDRRPSPAPV
jgi:hypothetical protein